MNNKMPVYFYALGRLEEINSNQLRDNSNIARDFVKTYYMEYGFGRTLNTVWMEYAILLHYLDKWGE